MGLSLHEVLLVYLLTPIAGFLDGLLERITGFLVPPLVGAIEFGAEQTGFRVLGYLAQGISYLNWTRFPLRLSTPFMLSFLTAAVAAVLLFAFMMVNVLVLTWLERKMFSRMWDMRGPMAASLNNMQALWWVFVVAGLAALAVWVWVAWFVYPGEVADSVKIAGVALGGFVAFGSLLWTRGHLEGAGFMQQLADGNKFFLKELIIPRAADLTIYNLAPILFVSSSIVLIAAIPFSDGFFAVDTSMGLIFTMGVFAVAPLAVLGGGWAQNNKYTLIGGMRSAAMMMSYEIPLLLSLVPVFIFAGTFNPLEIVQRQVDAGVWFGTGTFFLAPLVFMICLVAEVERIPFDLPEANSELVEGWVTEYTGMRFLFLLMAEYIRSFVGAAILVLVFFGGWTGPIYAALAPTLVGILGFDLAVLFMLAKIYLVFILFIWIRASLPRVRTDQILQIGWHRLLPLALIAIVIAMFMQFLDWTSWSLF